MALPPTDLFLNQAFTVIFDLYESDGTTLVSVLPDSVTFEIVSPTGVSVIKIFGVDNEVLNTIVPYRFRVNYDDLNAEVYWDWKFVAQWTTTPTIAGDVVIEGRIKVQSNRAKAT